MITPSLATVATQLKRDLELAWEPVGVVLWTKTPSPARPERRPRTGIRYCQALMHARRGKAVRLLPGSVSCPAAAAAFGFRKLPEGLHNGEALVGFGITRDAAVGRTMLERMSRLEPGRLQAIDLAPLSSFEAPPDVVIVEDRVERLMWLLLADVNLSGGERINADTAVLQATCVDVTLVPYTQNRLNFSFGCYGCREATDIEPGEAVVGFPGALLPGIAGEIGRLARKAISRSRAKRPYAALVGAGAGPGPFGGDGC